MYSFFYKSLWWPLLLSFSCTAIQSKENNAPNWLKEQRTRYAPCLIGGSLKEQTEIIKRRKRWFNAKVWGISVLSIPLALAINYLPDLIKAYITPYLSNNIQQTITLFIQQRNKLYNEKFGIFFLLTFFPIIALIASIFMYLLFASVEATLFNQFAENYNNRLNSTFSLSLAAKYPTVSDIPPAKILEERTERYVNGLKLLFFAEDYPTILSDVTASYHIYRGVKDIYIYLVAVEKDENSGKELLRYVAQFLKENALEIESRHDWVNFTINALGALSALSSPTTSVHSHHQQPHRSGLRDIIHDIEKIPLNGLVS